MRNQIIALFSLLLAALLPVSAQTQFIVSAPSNQIAQITAQFGLTLVETLNSTGGVYLVSAPANISVQQVLSELAGDPAIQTFEQDSSLESSEVEPGSLVKVDTSLIQSALSNTKTVSFYSSTVRAAYVNQPAASLIQLSNAQQQAGSAPVVVAVIDTGVDPIHPALMNSLVPGYDFTRNQPGIPSEWLDLSGQSQNALSLSSSVPVGQKTLGAQLNQSTVVILDQSTVVILDGNGPLPGEFGHGTMTAGLIHLVAPLAKIMPLKAFNADGSSQLSDIIRAIYYATDNGAKVISMSFSTETISPDLQAAVNYANAHEVICVASSGNDGMAEMTYPAGFAGVVGVGSTTNTDARSAFSNYGVPSVFMAAPGEGLITTFPGDNYAGVWGTSFSTALVSGSVALMAQSVSTAGYSTTADSLNNGHPINQSMGLGESRLDLYISLLNLIENEK